LFLFAYITGMRRGAIRSLHWRDVHDDTITLRKNNKIKEALTLALVGELIELRRTARKVKTSDGSVLLSEYSSTERANQLRRRSARRGLTLAGLRILRADCSTTCGDAPQGTWWPLASRKPLP